MDKHTKEFYRNISRDNVIGYFGEHIIKKYVTRKHLIDRIKLKNSRTGYIKGYSTMTKDELIKALGVDSVKYLAYDLYHNHREAIIKAVDPTNKIANSARPTKTTVASTTRRRR